MKLFKCQHCGQLLYFENDHCEQCSHRLGFIPEVMNLSAMEPEGKVSNSGEMTLQFEP